MLPGRARPGAGKLSQKQLRKEKARARKAKDEVDRSFLEAQAAADVATRRANQTATLGALFELLFR